MLCVFNPGYQRTSLKFGESQHLELSLSFIIFVSAQIQNWPKLFASVEGQTLYGAIRTQYDLMIDFIFCFSLFYDYKRLIKNSNIS